MSKKKNMYKLESLARLISGRTPEREQKEYYAETGTPWVKIENLDQGYIRETAEYLSEQGKEKVNLVPENSVLFSIVGTVGKVGIAGRELATNQQIVSLIFDETRVLPLYGYYALRYHAEEIRKLSNQTTMALISRKTLGQYRIYVPDSLEKQQEIVDKLRRFEEIKLKKEEMRSRMEQYEQVLFQRIFASQLRYGEKARLCNYLKEPVGTGIPKNEEPNGEFPCVRLENFRKTYLTGLHAGEKAEINAGADWAIEEKYRVCPGDILLRNGKLILVDRVEDPLYLDRSVLRIVKILEVGNAEAVQMSANATAKDADYLLHDTTNPGNMYAEATGLNVSGRYLRIVPLTTYTERWVELYELQINGGAYMTTESNRDIISETAEEAGKIPSNVFDGNFATTYKPSAANGSFTYRISEPDQRTIRIIQNGKASNADVQAVLYKDGAKQEAAAIGKLNQTINEFAVGKDSQILEVIVTWAEDIPEISIIKTSEKEKAAVNKDALNEAIKKPIDDKWTADSKRAAEEAKAAAEEIAANEYVTQEVVDLAAKALLAAHKNAVVKGDVTALENALNNMKAGKENVGAEEAPVYVEIYSARTYAAYESVMNEIREALKDKENVSEKEAQDLTAKLEKAEKALVYSSIQRELAETELENAVKYNKDDYTTVSYKAYTDAKSALDAIVKADKTERKNPKEVYTARNTFAQTEEGLVNVAALKAKLAEVGKLDENLYTKDSWKELQDAVKNAEAYLENGTKDQVDKAVSDLENAVNGLVEKTEVTVDDVIAEMEKINGKDYTEVSFGALQDAISKAKADKDQNDPALDQANITAMKEAKAALVSIVDLKAALNEAAQHKAGTYTVSSYKLLKDAVTNAEPLKVNGTKEEVANAAAAIRAAIKGLDKRAVGLDEYRDSIVLKKPEGYTEESYAAYKNAYDALMALDSKETTAEMFANAKSAFEAAQAGLVQKPGSNGTGSSSNGTVSNGAVATGDTVNVSALAGLFLSLLMIAAFMKRKTFLGFFEKDE